MAQRIVTFCDVHARRDEDVPAATFTVTMQGPDDGRPTSWEVDLCESDAKALVDLAAMLSEVGRVTDRPRGRKAQTAAREAAREAGRTAPDHPDRPACPVCGQTAKNRSALDTHTRKYHHVTLAEAEGVDLPFTCPECGRGAANPQGLAAHRRGTHGVTPAGRDEGPASN